MNTSELRSQLRQARRALSPNQQSQHTKQATQHLCASHLYQQSQFIALYLANDGELNPTSIIQNAWSLKKKIFLPALLPHQQKGLWFVQYHQHTRLIKNQYSIIEPDIRIHPPTQIQTLDMILLPLVGYDGKGNRLGMGGGFYDRTLAYKKNSPQTTPLLIGLAHSCQQLPSLQAQDWDIPLDAVVTEKGMIRFNR